jgi:hypothetical protein
VFQVQYVSVKYFQFGTVKQVTPSVSKNLVRHNVAVCIRYNDILDLDTLFNETGVIISKLALNESLDAGIENDHKITIDQIFKYTPSAEDIIETCMYRPDEYQIKHGNQTECEEVFHTLKMLTQESMCYVFYNTDLEEIPKTSVTQSTFFAYRVFDINFNGLIGDATMINVIGFIGFYPWLARDISPAPIDIRYENGVKRENYISISTSEYTYELLEAPYDTKCTRDGEADDYIECFQECRIKEFIRKVGKLPARLMIFEELIDNYGGLNVHRFSSIDEQNETLQNITEEIGKMCNKKCFFLPCEYGFSGTKISFFHRPNITFGVSLVTSTDPATVTTTKPEWLFIDYFTYVTSCLGTWFGISLLSINPFGLHAYWKRKHRVSDSSSEREIVLEYASFGRAREITRARNKRTSRPVIPAENE